MSTAIQDILNELKEHGGPAETKPVGRVLGWFYMEPNWSSYIVENLMPINRKVREKNLKKICRSLLHGTFRECYDPICFDENGNLINGQHRLKAIARTGVGAWVLVVVDCKHNALFDVNAVRSIGDAGVCASEISKEMGSIDPIAVMNQYQIATIGRESKFLDEAEKFQFLNKYGETVFKAIRISNKGKHNPICKKAAVRAAIFAALLDGVSEESLERFAYCVNTGMIAGPSESAAVVLREYLQNVKITGQKANDEILLRAQMAIKDFIDKKPRSRNYSKLENVYIHPEARA